MVKFSDDRGVVQWVKGVSKFAKNIEIRERVSERIFGAPQYVHQFLLGVGFLLVVGYLQRHDGVAHRQHRLREQRQRYLQSEHR